MAALCENSPPELGRLACEPGDDICLFQTTDGDDGQPGREGPGC